MPINTPGRNRIRYTLIAPVYDAVVRMGAQRRRAVELLRLRRRWMWLTKPFFVRNVSLTADR